MVSGVTKKRVGHARINGVVKDTGRNIHQGTRVGAGQKLDFDSHWTVSLYNPFDTRVPCPVDGQGTVPGLTLPQPSATIKAAEIVRIPLSPPLRLMQLNCCAPAKPMSLGPTRALNILLPRHFLAGRSCRGPSQWFASRPHCREAALPKRRPRSKHLSTKQSKPTWCKEPSLQRASRA
jgi:hypothetical protein